MWNENDQRSSKTGKHRPVTNGTGIESSVPTAPHSDGEGCRRAVPGVLQESDREQFFLICLNVKNEPTAIHTVSIGSLDSSIVHPRETFKAAVLANASSIIVAHNHPSGDPTPSQPDLEVTKRLQEAGELLGIPVLDHIIVGTEGAYVSLKEGGYM